MAEEEKKFRGKGGGMSWRREWFLGKRESSHSMKAMGRCAHAWWGGEHKPKSAPMTLALHFYERSAAKKPFRLAKRELLEHPERP
jgi:hypothetical protein